MSDGDIHISKQVEVSNADIQAVLSKRFGQAFDVGRRLDGCRWVEWSRGPSREEVWLIIAAHFPALVIETMVASWEGNGVDIYDGNILVQTPNWLFRNDFLNSPIEDFPRLLAAGCDPNEADEYGISPLQYCLQNEKASRAIALAKSGASVEQCKPEGLLYQDTLLNPAFAAYMESLSLDAECPCPPSSPPERSTERQRRI